LKSFKTFEKLRVYIFEVVSIPKMQQIWNFSY